MNVLHNLIIGIDDVCTDMIFYFVVKLSQCSSTFKSPCCDIIMMIIGLLIKHNECNYYTSLRGPGYAIKQHFWHVVITIFCSLSCYKHNVCTSSLINNKHIMTAHIIFDTSAEHGH